MPIEIVYRRGSTGVGGSNPRAQEVGGSIPLLRGISPPQWTPKRFTQEGKGLCT